MKNRQRYIKETNYTHKVTPVSRLSPFQTTNNQPFESNKVTFSTNVTDIFIFGSCLHRCFSKDKKEQKYIAKKAAKVLSLTANLDLKTVLLFNYKYNIHIRIVIRFTQNGIVHYTTITYTVYPDQCRIMISNIIIQVGSC
ncbi:hypothetical protein SAMN05444362_102269 [Dysgonomonas macrotermitis]|uniref:Uncharacterized protein n=1 Tax=Dysgonomonas macrotermitis TaxID=1346286 RepID=A0A1M4WNT5_9BACT|nr:hypothetical protein SAMN05444362_102269 [Dysgonomonas macrotermitis]